MRRMALLVWASVALAAPALAQDIGTLDDATAQQAYGHPTYSPYVGHGYPTRGLWGDTHLHTALSPDALMFGATLKPEDAYRLARGEEVRSSTGQRVRLSRPLDFLVVADHAEGLGTSSTATTPTTSARSYPSPPWTARTRRICGPPCRPMRTRPAGAFSPFPTART
jgi:hypothetical protein